MTEITVTPEMLAAGRGAGAAYISKGVFSDEWWAAVYRAMRQAESTPSVWEYDAADMATGERRRVRCCGHCGKPEMAWRSCNYGDCPLRAESSPPSPEGSSSKWPRPEPA